MKNKKKYLTKTEILSNFSNDCKCSVTYKDQKNCIDYSDLTHVKWKNVYKIRIFFKEVKKYRVDNESVRRDSVSYYLKEN